MQLRLKTLSTSPITWLLFIIALGFFFRSYQLVARFEFAHDGDLYSWIVTDIVVNHHFRLIGKLTSAAGILLDRSTTMQLCHFS